MFYPSKWAKCTFFSKKNEEKFGNSEKSSTFALAFRGTLLSNVGLQAEIAQLVEHDLAKVGVAGPSPVFRSFLFVIEKHAYYEFIFEIFRSRDICYKC